MFVVAALAATPTAFTVLLLAESSTLSLRIARSTVRSASKPKSSAASYMVTVMVFPHRLSVKVSVNAYPLLLILNTDYTVHLLGAPRLNSEMNAAIRAQYEADSKASTLNRFTRIVVSSLIRKPKGFVIPDERPLEFLRFIVEYSRDKDYRFSPREIGMVFTTMGWPISFTPDSFPNDPYKVDTWVQMLEDYYPEPSPSSA